MRRNLIRYFVGFQTVLQRANPHPKPLHQPEQHQDFILTIGVGMDQAPALDDFTDGFKFKVAARNQAASRPVSFPVLEIVSGGGEAVGDKGLHPHAGLRKARCDMIAPVGLFWIFAQREFDPRRSVAENQILGRIPVTEFDDAVLPVNRIGRAVKQVGGCHASGQLLVQIGRLRIHHIPDSDHRGRGKTHFIDVAQYGGVAVTIDNAGGDMPSGSIKDQCVGGRGSWRSSGQDFTTGNEQLRIGENARRPARPDRGVADQERRGVGDRSAAFLGRVRDPDPLSFP